MAATGTLKILRFAHHWQGEHYVISVNGGTDEAYVASLQMNVYNPKTSRIHTLDESVNPAQCAAYKRLFFGNDSSPDVLSRRFCRAWAHHTLSTQAASIATQFARQSLELGEQEKQRGNDAFQASPPDLQLALSCYSKATSLVPEHLLYRLNM